MSGKREESKRDEKLTPPAFRFQGVASATGLTIEITELPVWVDPRIRVGVPAVVHQRKQAEFYVCQEKPYRRASTAEKVKFILKWLGNRRDGECRQSVLAEDAVEHKQVSSVRQFNRLIKCAVEDGYLTQYRLRVSATGRPTYLLDWTVQGEGLFSSLAYTQPHPTFYRQMIKRHKSVEQVYLAMETRDWIVHTRYVWSVDDINLVPSRRRVQSARGEEGKTFIIDPDIVVTLSDNSRVVIELEVGGPRRTAAWYDKWFELGFQWDVVGIVTFSPRKMKSLVKSLAEWRKREPGAPRHTRFLFTNLRTLVKRSQPDAKDPLPPGEFWLAELAPASM